MKNGDKSDNGAKDVHAIDRQLVDLARRVFQASVDRLPDVAARRLRQARERALNALDAGS
jgi:hypothetical protein